jgi:hypothetical protein
MLYIITPRGRTRMQAQLARAHLYLGQWFSFERIKITHVVGAPLCKDSSHHQGVEEVQSLGGWAYRLSTSSSRLGSSKRHASPLDH